MRRMMNARDLSASAVRWGVTERQPDEEFFSDANQLLKLYEPEVLADEEVCVESVEVMADAVYPDGIPESVEEWLNSL